MIPIPGYVYFIQDEFFKLFGNPSISKICCNKGDGHGRPYYCCKKVPESEFFWMIPMTTKTEKYSSQYLKQKDIYGKCITITPIKFAGKRGALLIQNAIPIHPHYIENPYRKNGNTVPLHKTVQTIAYGNLQKSLALHRRGHQVFFPDVDYIYELQSTLAERDFKLPLEQRIILAGQRTNTDAPHPQQPNLCTPNDRQSANPAIH